MIQAGRTCVTVRDTSLVASIQRMPNRSTKCHDYTKEIGWALHKKVIQRESSWVDEYRTARGSERMLALHFPKLLKKPGGIECGIRSLPRAVLHLSTHEPSNRPFLFRISLLLCKGDWMLDAINWDSPSHGSAHYPSDWQKPEFHGSAIAC